MKRTWVYFYAILFSALFGLMYFSAFTFINQERSTLVDSPNVQQVVTLYLNQLGIYKNASTMTQNVAKLSNQGIDVMTYQKNDLTYFVTHITLKEEEAKQGIAQLNALGFNPIMKSYEIRDAEVINLLKQGEYETVLASMEATNTVVEQ